MVLLHTSCTFTPKNEVLGAVWKNSPRVYGQPWDKGEKSKKGKEEEKERENGEANCESKY